MYMFIVQSKRLGYVQQFYSIATFLRPNSWMKSRQKSSEFSSLLFTVTSTALPWDLNIFNLTQPLSVSTVQLMYTKKGENPYPPLHGLKNPHRNLKCENSQDFACPETSMKLYVHEFGLCTAVATYSRTSIDILNKFQKFTPWILKYESSRSLSLSVFFKMSYWPCFKHWFQEKNYKFLCTGDQHYIP